jgi:large subunit ribosomal protein L31
MKSDIHPQYYNEAEVECACGVKFSVGSTMDKLRVEICGNCHPFYTGEEKVMDTAGRVEKFKQRAAKALAKPPKTKQ